MKLLLVLSVAVAICSAQRYRQRDSQERDDYYEDPRAQAYKFGYNTGNEGPAQIFREETKRPDGSIVGKYGYVDPNGQLRIINYSSAPRAGFQASRGDGRAQEQEPQQEESLGGNPTSHYVSYPYEGAFQYQHLY